MGRVYWELKEIPQPEGAHVNNSDDRVFIFLPDGKNIRDSKRKVIGHATSSTMMHPNDTFRYLYPELWKEYYGDGDIQEHVLHSGMYALTLGIGYKTSLYPLLIEAYGPLYANAIMDYSMYSILEKSDTSQTYPDRMRREIIFSKELYTDSWLCDLFRHKMTENNSYMFRNLWMEKCRERNVSKVWLSIDGSNNDCQAEKSSLPEKGKAKSGKNVKIISYIYAVNAEDGCPVTYFVNNGKKVDSKAFEKMAAFLAGHGMEIAGVILDRGFCTHDVFQLLNQFQYPFVVMLKSDTYAHTQMLAEYGETIRWKVPYAVGGKGVFGISAKKKLFGSHEEEAYVSLYYDGANGTQRAVTLIGKVMDAVGRMKEEAAKGEKPTVPEGMAKYISVSGSGETYEINCNYEKWQKDVDAKGYSSIAASEDFGPAETSRIYHLRDSSEKQYMFMKSQLGYDVMRVHYTEGIENKFAVCFIASIIRSEIMNACRKLGLATNQMLTEIDRLELVLLPNNIYSAIHDETQKQKTLLKEFDIIPDDFNEIAQDVNRRITSPVNSQVHRKPEHARSGHKKKRGRPVGSKNKKSISKSNTENEVKRKPGRPKGSKNKSTLEKEKTAEIPVKRKPGRPKGSKNKPKDPEVLHIKRGRGRPKGSKNKKTLRNEQQ